MITKINAWPFLIFPAGISRWAVLGFNLSYFSSIHRLNAIAALLAKTIHKITNKNKSQYRCPSPVLTPRKKPISAKGMAKMVCANFTRERYFLMDSMFVSSLGFRVCCLALRVLCSMSRVMPSIQTVKLSKLNAKP